MERTSLLYPGNNTHSSKRFIGSTVEKGYTRKQGAAPVDVVKNYNNNYMKPMIICLEINGK